MQYHYGLVLFRVASEVRYAQDAYSFGEADEFGNITVELDGSVVTDFTVTVFEIGGEWAHTHP